MRGDKNSSSSFIIHEFLSLISGLVARARIAPARSAGGRDVARRKRASSLARRRRRGGAGGVSGGGARGASRERRSRRGRDARVVVVFVVVVVVVDVDDDDAATPSGRDDAMARLRVRERLESRRRPRGGVLVVRGARVVLRAAVLLRRVRGHPPGRSRRLDEGPDVLLLAPVRPREVRARPRRLGGVDEDVTEGVTPR